MKKSILLLLLCFVITSCASQNDSYESEGNHYENEVTDTPTLDKGSFEGIVYDWDIDLEDTTLTYLDFVVDENLAKEIGDSVIKNVFGEKAMLGTYFIVCEIAERNFFVVTRASDDYAPGGSYSVAINKKDGKILKIWIEE